MTKKKTKKKPASTSAVLKAALLTLQVRYKAVAAERDKLNELISDLEDLSGSCDDALDGIQTAIDALSRYA